MKIYRLTVKTENNSGFTVYDSSEARITRDYEHAIRSRWTSFAEVGVISQPNAIKRNQMLDALNGRAHQWKFQPLFGYEREEMKAA